MAPITTFDEHVADMRSFSAALPWSSYSHQAQIQWASIKFGADSVAESYSYQAIHSGDLYSIGDW